MGEAVACSKIRLGYMRNDKSYVRLENGTLEVNLKMHEMINQMERNS